MGRADGWALQGTVWLCVLDSLLSDSAVKGGKRLPGSIRKGTGASKGAEALWGTHGVDEANPMHPASPRSQASARLSSCRVEHTLRGALS